MPTIPTNSHIDKTLPGLGATTLELSTLRNSILMEPNVPVIKGKKRKGLLSVYEGVTIDDVIDYLSSNIQYKKIMVTPESFFKIKEAAEFLNINLYEDYMFLFDESDRIIQDVGFRKKISFPMDDFFRFKNKAFISATALEPSDPRFKKHGFEHPVIQPDFDYSKDIDLITTNNVYLSLKNAIANNPSDSYCVFFNSTNMIGACVKKMETQAESQIYCSRESVYQLRLSKFPHVNDHLQGFKKYNFFTSRFNSAVDIMMDTKPVVIILTDVHSANHSMVHPKTESVQIVGRFRNGASKIIHITNLDAELLPKSEEEIKGWLSGCEQTYNNLRSLHKAATNQGAKDLLSDCLTLIPYANFINADGSKNYFMEDNTFLEESIKRSYLNEKAFVDSYKFAHFNPTHFMEDYPLSDLKDNKLTSGISMSSVVEAVIESLTKIDDPASPYTFDNRQTVSNELEKSFPEIVEAFKLLGPDELRKNGYSKTQIKKAVKARKMENQKSNYGFLVSLQNSFEDGIDYPTHELRRLLVLAIAKNGLTLRPHITLLQDYFEMSNRKTLGFDKMDKEIKGYRIIQCKFNRPE